MEDFCGFLCYNDIVKEYSRILLTASAVLDSSIGAHAPTGLYYAGDSGQQAVKYERICKAFLQVKEVAELSPGIHRKADHDRRWPVRGVP